MLGAVSVATAALSPGSPAHAVLAPAVAAAVSATPTTDDLVISIEHPTGSFDAALTFAAGLGGPEVHRAGIIRTARRLFDGVVYPRPAA